MDELAAEQTPGKAPREPKRSDTRNALVLMVGTLFSRVTGLVRNSLLIQLFSTQTTDAFLIAYKVPNLFRELLAEGALTNSFVPVYKTLGREEARRLSGALLGLLALVNGLLLLLAIPAAPWIVDLLVGSELNIDVELTIRLTRLVFPFLATVSFSALVMGVLQAEERFLAPAWAPVALNVVTVALMLLYPGREAALALIFVAGGLAQLLVQLPALKRYGLLPSRLAWWHPALANVLLLMVPFTFTTSGRQILNVVSNRVLTTISEGAVTAFFNADLFLSLALGLFSISPALAFYSRLSDEAVHAPEAFAGTLLRGLRLISFLIVPAGFILWFLAGPVTVAVFDWMRLLDPEAGAPAQVLRLSALALAPLGFAVFPLGLNNLLIRTFYVRQEVRVPIIVTLVFISVHAVLYWQLAARYGIVGMSWATVIVAWSQFAVLFFLVARREGLESGSFLIHTLKVWLAAGSASLGAMTVLAFVPLNGGWWGEAFRAGFGAGLLALLYLALSHLLRIPEARAATGRLRAGRK